MRAAGAVWCHPAVADPCDRRQRLAGQLLLSLSGRAAAAARLGGLIAFSLSFSMLRDSDGMVPPRYWGQQRCLCKGLQQRPLSPGPFTLDYVHLPSGSISQVDTLDREQLAKGTERPGSKYIVPGWGEEATCLHGNKGPPAPYSHASYAK